MRRHILKHVHTWWYIYIYVPVCLCVCMFLYVSVCVCLVYPFGPWLYISSKNLGFQWTNCFFTKVITSYPNLLNIGNPVLTHSNNIRPQPKLGDGAAEVPKVSGVNGMWMNIYMIYNIKNNIMHIYIYIWLHIYVYIYICKHMFPHQSPSIKDIQQIDVVSTTTHGGMFHSIDLPWVQDS